MTTRPLTLLVIAVLVAGCTALPGQDTGTGTDVTVTPQDGLSTSLQPSARSIQDGDPFTVELDVQNTGQTDSDIVSAVLFGSSVFDGCSAARSPSADSPITLNAALPDADQVGGQTRLRWTCDAVTTNLGAGESDSFPVGIQIGYTYNTTARTSFTVQRQGEEGDAVGQGTSNTAAPVHAAINIADPAVLDSDSDPVSVPLTIRNVGDGEVSGDVSMAVSTPQSPGSVTQCPETATLLDGQRQVLCRITFQGSPPESGTQVFVEVSLSYRYTEQDETSITITG